MASKGRSPLQDSSESDTDPEGEPCRAAPSCAPPPRSQVIHSGHFMVSSPHSDSAPRRRKSGGSLRYDFDTVNRTWCQTYRYGPLSSGSLSIDPTLTRLFECMSLAYSGRIVSPKWKSFKGLRLLWRDKIRLNNAIWRAWFIQYVEKRKNPVCGFVSPLEGSEADAHRKPEAIILEGSYWKRRIEVVIKEYHKWRIYYKKRLQKKKDDILSMLQEGQICQAKLDKRSNQIYQEPEAAPVEAHMFDLDCLLSDISDTLFTMTQKPCAWTSDRHNTYTSNADIIQPGLTPLQPNLDDFMDIPDIFMNYRGQPSEQTGFTDCGYYESSSSAAFAPVPSPVVTAPQLLIDTQLAQPNLSSNNLPSTSNTQPDQTRPGQDCGEYHTSPIISGAMPYGHQSYHDPPAPIAFSSSTEQPAPASVPFLYPLPCHKFGYHTTTSMTSTVITHTASTVGAQGSVHQTHGYPHAGDTYSQTPCHPLSYSAAVSDLVHAALPSVTTTHCFSVPEQVAVTGVRGKHKQKTGGARAIGPCAVPTSPPSTASTATSCLAKLLSSSAHERKPALGFDSNLATAKGQRSSSPSSSTGSGSHVGAATSQLQYGAGWPAGIPALTPLPCQSASLGHTGTHGSASRGSAVSALLTHGSTHTGTTLLIPKTEKLSPVQLYGADRSSLTVSFPAHPGQTSPPNPLDRTSNPESPHSGYSGHGKIESSKQTETRRITHISAEQKRRFNIKLGFDTLHDLVTTLSSQPSIKISKATTLQKTAEYISKMQQERAQLHEEAQRLREEIQLLNSAINACQQQLPATGVPITRQRFDHMRQKFREYVRAQTLQNWKFWIFSIIIEPLFESYNGMVSTASVEDLCRSTLSWLDQHCSLPALRPMVLSSLRLLSTTTAILTDPSLLPEQAALAVTQGDPAAALDHSLQPASRQ
ncbi:carbohydrate-responsive element-binding protein isoform X2 [Stegastes partitus]|uniref:Carbohydrate-responsive element-binding protein isoform X1 n=1 Tax=Stegastes partitus TaxID=144197 RepID=A0A3B4Z8D5_9TELE|nr:PREDICTED: carbohydrate-responsive element-binding protein isoform X1 [Stegastes partitus]XP_008284571.1 PREDICTED: carbohydrate-responsive element-binding protein isoform X1 [Stegastes partitus]XP_008284572.1 PREDICTED: carbohydrate-responsive element-binding protein isoform X2 [Stegastes partitus]